MHSAVCRISSFVPSETNLDFSPPKHCKQLLSQVCSVTFVFIPNEHWSIAKRWLVFHLRHGVSNFCHTSAATVLSRSPMFAGRPRNDKSFYDEGGHLLTYVCMANYGNTWDTDISWFAASLHAAMKCNHRPCRIVANPNTSQRFWAHLKIQDSKRIPMGFLRDTHRIHRNICIHAHVYGQVPVA